MFLIVNCCGSQAGYVNICYFLSCPKRKGRLPWWSGGKGGGLITLQGERQPRVGPDIVLLLNGSNWLSNECSFLHNKESVAGARARGVKPEREKRRDYSPESDVGRPRGGEAARLLDFPSQQANNQPYTTQMPLCPYSKTTSGTPESHAVPLTSSNVPSTIGRKCVMTSPVRCQAAWIQVQI